MKALQPMTTHSKQDMHPIYHIIKCLCASGVLLLAACKPPAGGADSHAGHGHEGEGKAPGAHVQGGICQEHKVPEGACGICNPDKIADLKPGESLQLRLPSESSVDVAGIKTAKPGEDLVADGSPVMRNSVSISTSSPGFPLLLAG